MGINSGFKGLIPYPSFSSTTSSRSFLVHGSKIVNHHNAVAKDIWFGGRKLKDT